MKTPTPDDEHPPPADQVGHRAGRQQERRERECVGVDDPLEIGEARAEIALDRGQRDVDDRHVEQQHESRQAHRDERPPLAHATNLPARLPEASGTAFSFLDQMSGQLAAETMEADLRALVDTIQCPHLRALLDRIFCDETWQRFRCAPAAKHYHQAYEHGLLEHSLTVAQGVSAMASTFGGIDRDVAVAGALLHDIGKLDAYATGEDGIYMTDLGKLQGEIPLGLLPRPPPHRGPPRLPGADRRRAAAHHPRPPRRARARVAGRPLHPRGDARAHDRQPRRPPRVVRPHRARAARTASAGRASIAPSRARRSSPIAPPRSGALPRGNGLRSGP